MSDFVGAGTIDEVVRQVCAKKSPISRDRLRAALLKFFAEDDPDCTAIKWNLAQNYYIARALASISTRNNSVNGKGMLGDEIRSQANWMISFLSPNQGIEVG
jgi:hypothetical protein